MNINSSAAAAATTTTITITTITNNNNKFAVYRNSVLRLLTLRVIHSVASSDSYVLLCARNSPQTNTWF
jgi:hypothetical protein